MNDPDDFWSNRFHSCALAAGFIAHAEGRLADGEYVRRLCYDLYESGAFRPAGQQAGQQAGQTSVMSADRPASRTHAVSRNSDPSPPGTSG